MTETVYELDYISPCISTKLIQSIQRFKNRISLQYPRMHVTLEFSKTIHFLNLQLVHHSAISVAPNLLAEIAEWNSDCSTYWRSRPSRARRPTPSRSCCRPLWWPPRAAGAWPRRTWAGSPCTSSTHTPGRRICSGSWKHKLNAICSRGNIHKIGIYNNIM
jgi:hypothetical protein